MDDTLQLIHEAQTGNAAQRRAAFDALLPRYQRMAFQVAYAVLGDVHLAEDAVQEAFITAYLRIGQLREAEAFATWLKRIVLTQADRQIRGKRPRLEDLEARFDLPAEKPSPEAILEENEIQSRLQYAIDSLPEQEREVTEGFYLQGESQKELAERLELPLTTVKKRLQYAREHLRLMIGDLNAVVDEAIAHIFQTNQPKPQRQPVYIYSRRKQDEDEGY
jgi:RNA polymerase sigma factor (sigma-70 family)